MVRIRTGNGGGATARDGRRWQARWLAALSLLLLLMLPALLPSAHAAELLMFEQAGCPFCRNFDAEIAPDYPQSRIGKIAPLRRVDIFEDRRGGIAGLTPAVFTPTFVLVGDDGREIGRLEGYPGQKWFYPEIETIFDGATSASDVGDQAGTPGRTPATQGK